jgi:hypothetical protein
LQNKLRGKEEEEEEEGEEGEKRRRNEGWRCWVFGKVHISLAVVVHWILGIPVLLLFSSLEQRHCTLGQQREGRKEGRENKRRWGRERRGLGGEKWGITWPVWDPSRRRRTRS